MHFERALSLQPTLVYRLFLTAHIVYVQRDPRDVCLSCFFQLFKLNRAMPDFTNLAGTLRFYSAVVDLWLRYREVLPLNLFEVRYESLVGDIEPLTRELIAFLGAPWKPEIL